MTEEQGFVKEVTILPYLFNRKGFERGWKNEK